VVVRRNMLFKTNKDQLLLVGDIHGDIRSFANLVDLTGIDHERTLVVQLGDWGIGWENAKPSLLGFDVLVIDGNHENFDLIETGRWNPPNVTHLKRGSVLELGCGFRFGICGGADSIDKEWRTPGFDWFPEETISQSDLDRCLEWEGVSAVLAHDVFEGNYARTLNMAVFKRNSSSRALQVILDSIKPRWWFHGHHHKLLKTSFQDQCEVWCLNTITNFPDMRKALKQCCLLVDATSPTTLSTKILGG